MPDSDPTRRQFLKVAGLGLFAAPAARIPLPAPTPTVAAASSSALVADVAAADRLGRLWLQYQILTRAEARRILGV